LQQGEESQSALFLEEQPQAEVEGQLPELPEEEVLDVLFLQLHTSSAVKAMKAMVIVKFNGIFFI